MTKYEIVRTCLKQHPHTWLVTGVAGFIGSNLLETLLLHNQKVRGLDNFSTGHRHNLQQVRERVSSSQWAHFQLLEGDIRNPEDCHKACAGVDYILHQAAIGSVPRSVEEPVFSNDNNVSGFLNILVAARESRVKRLVYASSSAVYGDEASLPKVEHTIGTPLSPYAVTKYVNELYAEVFARCHDFRTVGLRYFNIFGPRQDPQGAYAAVIPKWVASLLRGAPLYINGDGETSRDFCFVDNVVQANLLAALTDNETALNQVYNVAVHERTTLNQLFETLRDLLAQRFPEVGARQPVYNDFRAGDVRHSLADVGKAERLLGYAPSHSLRTGLELTLDWYIRDIKHAYRLSEPSSGSLRSHIL